MLRGSMPDLRAEVNDLVAEGDRVAARVSVTGTHTGEPLFGTPASGRRIRIEQFHIVQCNDEALGIRHWAYAGVDQMSSQVIGQTVA